MPAESFLERLMKEYGDTLLRMRYLYLKDYYLAQDAVQETFLKAMKAYGSFEHKASEKTWLTRIAVNCSITIRSCPFGRLPGSLAARKMPSYSV